MTTNNLEPAAPADLSIWLERKFAAILSPRRPLERLTENLASIDELKADFVRRWVEVVAKSNLELAYEFAALAAEALNRFGERGTRAWVLDALAVYDREGLYPAVAALSALDDFAVKHRQARALVKFVEVEPHLRLFLRGLSGRDLQLAAADRAYTDTETLFLPAQLTVYPEAAQNRQLYKAMAVILWAQTVYGTFRRAHPDAPTLEARLQAYPQRAEAIFLRLETIRLLAAIQRELPGLYRQMALMREPEKSRDATWATLKARLEAPEATVETTFAVLDTVLTLDWLPDGYAFESGFELAAVEATMQARHQREAAILAAELEGMMAQGEAEQNAPEQADAGSNATDEQGEAMEAPSLPPNLQQLVDSLLQDYDELPDFSTLESGVAPGEDGEALDNLGEPADANAHYYDEWDHARQAYRTDWCRVVEREIPAPENDYRAQVIAKYPHLVKAIHRVFDGLRDAPMVLKKQTDGEDIDLDAALAAEVDRRSGQEISERIYLRRNHEERSVAVMILVDVSGSTKGWINQAERESLILICEALDRLDDRYALVAFSGMTRERCEVFPLKDFDEPNTVEVQARIGGLQPRYYTRMGAAIRYASEVLDREPAKHRILLVLSDGKPDDYDGYKGDYGIEDSRRALLEARAQAIKPFCITIDADAQDYLPHLFGESGYTLLDDVSKLPLKIADIYRRLSASH